MPAPKWVKKRDGRPEPYDENKVARAIARASQDTRKRSEALDLAKELARSVTFFLGRGGSGPPETRAIAEAVERALTETGHANAARRFREHREWRTARRAAVKVRDEPAPRAPAEDVNEAVEVLSSAGANPWSKRKIVETLREEAGIAAETAEDVARAVEERIFASGLTRVGSSLLRELIDAELFERGFSAQLAKLEVVGVAKSDLRALVSLEGARAAAAIEGEVARAALERFALDDLVGGEAAAAHRRGEVHLVGLGRPYRLAAGGASAVELSRGAATPLEVARRLARAARTARPSYDSAFGLARVDLAFAPFAGDPGFLPALEALLDDVTAPSPEEATTPHTVLTVEAASPDAPARRVRDALLGALHERGVAAAGARLALLVRPTAAADAEDVRQALGRAVAAAHRESPVELALLPRGARPATARGHAGDSTPCAAVQVACLNLARTALEAGRGERGRLTAELARAVEAALSGLHERRQNAVSSVVRPELPLWRPRVPEAPGPAGVRPRTLEPPALADVLAVVGLEAGLRYFTGESPAENRRVAKLAREVLLEVQALAQARAPGLALALRFEDAPAGEAPQRLAALDLDRYDQARQLVLGRGGWDPGLALGPVGQDPVPTLAARADLASALETALALPRTALAAADPGALAAAVTGALG